MFDLFTRRTAKDYLKSAEETYVMPKAKEPQEFYRVGYVSETGMTTLTLIGENGISSTLSMNQSACEQLIRMLRSTYMVEETTEEPT